MKAIRSIMTRSKNKFKPKIIPERLFLEKEFHIHAEGETGKGRKKKPVKNARAVFAAIKGPER